MHVPVLPAQVLDLLRPRPGSVMVDGTVGSGGHARLVLERIGPEGRLVAIDRDPAALVRTAQRLTPWGGQCILRQGDFGSVAEIVSGLGVGPVDGILLDLGLSSEQIESAERGFSFERPGPLDMRMTPAEGSTAADLVNRLSEPELAEVFRRYGEERQAGRIARAVARSRCEAAITTTDRLAAVVAAAVGGRRGRLHPATRVFQALRMAVNGELNSLDRALEGGLSVLRPGGRLAVIAFESLTDRVVKRCFVAHAGRWVSLAAGGRGWEGRHPKVRLLTRKPVRPGPDEVRANARARSARLRAVERLSEEEANADSKCPDGGHGRG